LVVSGGGTISMGGNITRIGTVDLTPNATPYNFTANGIAGLTIADVSTGLDTLTAGGSNQTLTGGAAGKVTMVSSALGGDIFKNTSTLFNGDTIMGFTAPGDVIDVTNIGVAAMQPPVFVQNTVASGTLSFTDGVHNASVTLFGQFVSAGFQTATDGAGGTDITYHPPAAATALALHSPAP
jgi:hypothetical protein